MRWAVTEKLFKAGAVPDSGDKELTRYIAAVAKVRKETKK